MKVNRFSILDTKVYIFCTVIHLQRLKSNGTVECCAVSWPGVGCSFIIPFPTMTHLHRQTVWKMKLFASFFCFICCTANSYTCHKCFYIFMHFHIWTIFCINFNLIDYTVFFQYYKRLCLGSLLDLIKPCT